MKVRTDYVSNSSTSSFVLIGDVFSKEDFENSSFFGIKKDPNEYNGYADYDEEVFFEKCAELGLSIKCGLGDYYDEYVVGLGKIMKLLNSLPEKDQIDRKYVSTYLGTLLK